MRQSLLTCLSEWVVGNGELKAMAAVASMWWGCDDRLRELWETALVPPEPGGTNTLLLLPGSSHTFWEALPYLSSSITSSVGLSLSIRLQWLNLRSNQHQHDGKAYCTPQEEMYFLLNGLCFWALRCSIYKDVTFACWRHWQNATRPISCLFFKFKRHVGILY